MSNTTRAYLEYEQYTEHDREYTHRGYGRSNSIHQQCIDALVANGFSANEASNVARALIRIHGNNAPEYAVERYPN